jgi:hypothetical protein
MDAMYFTPERPHQLSLFTDIREISVKKFDALYVTRPQRERYTEEERGTQGSYFRVDRSALAGAKFRETVVLHPLPRVDELAYDLDEDPRSIYFQQAARGVPVRMAVLGFLLGRFELKAAPPPRAPAAPQARVRSVLECSNANCVTHAERRYLTSEFTVASRDPLRVQCSFCDTERPVAFVGCSSTRHYHPVNAPEIHRIKMEHLVFFASEAIAVAAGYAPSGARGATDG